MKRTNTFRKGLYFLLIIVMSLFMALPALAANRFDAHELMGEDYLFPGDTLQGAERIIKPDGSEEQTGGGDWTNSSDGIVYRIRISDDAGMPDAEWSEDGEAGDEGADSGITVVLEEAGYVLSVREGDSRSVYSESGSASYMPQDPSEMEDQHRPDICGYEQGTEVEISAGAAPEGQVFDYWEVTNGDGQVFLADPNAEVTTFTMPDKKVEITAHFKTPEAPEQEQMPEEFAQEQTPEEQFEQEQMPEDPGFGDGGEQYYEENGDDSTPAQENFEENWTSDDSGLTQTPEGYFDENGNYVDGESGITFVEGDTYNPDQSGEGDVWNNSDQAGEGDVWNNSDQSGEGDVWNSSDQAGEGDVWNSPEAEGDGSQEEWPSLYTLKVVNGTFTTEESYAEGDTIPISAEEVEGYTFLYWICKTGDMEIDLGEEARTAHDLSFVMPAADIEMTAVYTQAQPEEIPEEAEIIPDPEIPEEQPQEEEQVPEEQPQEEEQVPEEQPQEEEQVPEEQPQEEEQVPEEQPQEEEQGQNEQEEVFYTLTVENGMILENGSSDGEFPAGSVLTVSAEGGEGETFDSWTTDDESLTIAEPSSPETVITLSERSAEDESGEAGEVLLTANFTTDDDDNQGGDEKEEVPETVKFNITVNGGTADKESASEGEIVNVSADDASGFLNWDTVPEDLLSDPYRSDAAFEMPGEDVILSANYEELYTLTVNSGTASAGEETGQVLEIPEGTEVVVTADSPAEGMEFIEWLDGDEEMLEDPTLETVSFAMPAKSLELTATYEEIPPTEYSVTVVNGSFLVDGEETDVALAGDTITLWADEPDEGMEFGGWQSSDVTLNDPFDTETTFTMPEKDVTVTAVYSQIPVYTITTASNDIAVAGARGGSGTSYTAREGDVIAVTAKAYTGSNFIGWKITADGKDLPYFDDENNYLEAGFVMPAQNVRVQAVYEKIPENQVRVINGKGSGTYKEGDKVTITANAPAAGYKFKQWEVLTGNASLANAGAEKTTFAMPSSAVQVRAVYQRVTYTLTVKNGTQSGSGTYYAGDTVNLTAVYPADGKEFDSWTVTTKNASVSSPNRFYTTIKMPAANVTVQANYRNGPSPSYNEIQGIKNGWEYKTGTNLTFTAVGNGMGNTYPNPGDFRWKPTSYQIGTVKGTWKNGQYTTTMSISTPGEYTLAVLFSKEIFDGRSWTSTGTVDQKSVTFKVSDNPKAAQTGDDTPILPMVLAAAIALLVIILVVVTLVLRRRRR